MPNSKGTRLAHIKGVGEFERLWLKASQTYLPTKHHMILINIITSKQLYTLKTLNMQFANRHVPTHAAWRSLGLK